MDEDKYIGMQNFIRLTTEFTKQIKELDYELSPEEEEELYADFICQFERGIEHPNIKNK